MENRSYPILKLTHKADAVELNKIRANLKKYLIDIETDLNDISIIVIAVNEVCMNIIQHANNGKYNGNIDIVVRIECGSLVINISDTADICDLNKFVPLDRGELKPGGLGLHIISEVMDSVEYSHKNNNDGNCVIMKKKMRISNGI